jgi:hypothetical protein
MSGFSLEYGKDMTSQSFGEMMMTETMETRIDHREWEEEEHRSML